MPHYTSHEDLFSSSHFLAGHAPRKSPSRQSISARRSSASLRGPSNLINGTSDDASNGRHHSLAHELAVALMPEPSSGSKLLAEEFGIEFDEGAEGIDEQPLHENHISEQEQNVQLTFGEEDTPSFADELVAQAHDASFEDESPAVADEAADLDPVFDSPTIQRTRRRPKTPEKDAMDVLSESLEFTERFLTELRTLDTELGTSSSQQPKLERAASDVIRRMNETVRDREGQVRVLLECEREFRKIAGQVGGTEVLGQLEELEGTDELTEPPSTTTFSQPLRLEPRQLHTLEEEPTSLSSHHLSHNLNDWELDPDRNHLGDADYDSSPVASPIKDSFPPPPPVTGPITPAKTIPQLTHLRSSTTSLVSSLTSISEHAQVTGVATADAGRKLRSLKNKLGSWRTEWESAERSRARIERWEAGIADTDGSDGAARPPSPARLTGKRVDGRKLVQEQLQAFERVLADAALKTKAIMAR